MILNKWRIENIVAKVPLWEITFSLLTEITAAKVVKVNNFQCNISYKSTIIVRKCNLNIAKQGSKAQKT